MGDPANLCCVKCNSVLDKALFQGLEVDLCPKCGGLWLDRGEITRAAKLPEAELARLRGLLTGSSGPPPVPTPNKAPCPACTGSLSEVVLGAVLLVLLVLLLDLLFVLLGGHGGRRARRLF